MRRHGLRKHGETGLLRPDCLRDEHVHALTEENRPSSLVSNDTSDQLIRHRPVHR